MHALWVSRVRRNKTLQRTAAGRERRTATMGRMGRRRRLFSSRRRRASSADAGIVILGLIAIVIATIGVYLLIAGAIALVVWLVAAVAKSQPVAGAAHIAVASEPTAAAAPEHPYRQLTSLEPRVFAEARALEAAACDVFARWARQLPNAPLTAGSTIRALRMRNRLIGRLTTRLDGRRFVWRAAPYRGRERFTGVPVDPTRLDPYNPPPDLRSHSRYLRLCQQCSGDGRVSCTACGGAARVTCSGCQGAGKLYGVTANGARRLLNCKTCKGKASLACGACSRGEVDCAVCAASGRVENWLELDGGPRDGDVQVEPDGDITRAFVWGVDGVAVSHDEIAKDAIVVCSITNDRALTLADLPNSVPDEWRHAHWVNIQARLQPGERVVAQTFTLLDVPSVEVVYGVGRQEQSIELEGLRLLAPPAAADHVFAARAASLRRLAYVLAAVPVAVGAAYLARGTYFANVTALGVVACTAVACAMIYAVLKHALAPRARRWIAAAVIPIAAAVMLALLGEPSVATARARVEAGALDEARAELEALGDDTDPELAPLWRDVHQREALALSSCPDVVKKLEHVEPGTPQHAAIAAHADARAAARVEELLKRESFDEARSALACASAEWRQNPGRVLSARIELAAASACSRKRDWDCALDRSVAASNAGAPEGAALHREVLRTIHRDVEGLVESSRREKDVAARVQHQRSALALAAKYLSAAPPDLTSLHAANVKDEQQLARIQAKERKRVEAEEARRHELAARAERRRLAEEARARRREEAAARRSEPQGLLCCDGTLSPTCSCGGSRRGCCSHHGGVCGCR
jgi:hypothetical protein